MSVTKMENKKNNLGFENQFYEAIMDSYQNFNFSNATFLAERLRFIQDCEKSRCILAECYMASQKFHQAYEILKDLKGLRAKFLFAKVCFQINNLHEAENVLLNQERTNQQKVFSKKALENVVNDAQGLFLLGQIKEKGQKFGDAAECYLRAFQRNPLLFTCLEKFLKISQKVEDQDIEKIIEAFKVKNSQDQQHQEIEHTIFKAYNDYIKVQKENAAFTDYSQKKNIDGLKKNRNIMKKAQTFQLKMQELTKIGNRKSPSKKKLKKSSSNRVFQTQKQMSIFNLLSSLAKPMALFQKEDHRKSLELYQNLPQIFQNDPWVSLNIGKCYTEFSDHKQADSYFKKAFTQDPARIDGTEYYSSCLWHLKKLPELTQLAFSCLKKHYFEPETWITLANCYSLNQDHDMALKLLARAIQIDPNNAYAHCMTGHEFSSKENYENANEYYKKAINLDKRNVRAYWGLGNLNLKTERYKKAIDYFSRAIKFNNDTPTVYTQLAIAHLNLEEYEEALRAITIGEKLAPKDAFNRYHKAQILFKLNQLEEAENVCQSLLKDHQKEPQIYILLAQILKEQGKKSEAHNALVNAQTLDQKNQQKIKQMIESLYPN